ncbi:Fc.00g104560.m01.CDS01 [Cosmosporella sp. VM-42]
MAPSSIRSMTRISLGARQQDDPTAENNSLEQVIVEAWGQGLNVGAIAMLILIVLCNYRRHVLLHKLILLELVLAIGHGTFIFFPDPTYGWVLSSTATPLYISYTVHNVIAWLKIKPFLPGWGARFFIGTIVLVQPYWILEAWANFQYFNMLGSLVFEKTRFLEPLMSYRYRDPWWVFTTVKLVLIINKNYNFTLINLFKTSPRFGVMLGCLFLSIVFLIADVAFIARATTQSGINPFWRLALVFKCASDVIFLDDFKVVLDRIAESALRRFGGNFPYGTDENGISSSKHGGGSGTARGARHMVTISTNNRRDPNHQKYNGWPERRVGEERSVDRSDPALGDDELSKHQIRAKTTITISKQEGLGRKDSGSSTTHRYGSQDNILPPDDLATLGAQGQHDVKASIPMTSIPMMPLRARTKEKN